MDEKMYILVKDWAAGLVVLAAFSLGFLIDKLFFKAQPFKVRCRCCRYWRSELNGWEVAGEDIRSCGKQGGGFFVDGRAEQLYTRYSFGCTDGKLSQ